MNIVSEKKTTKPLEEAIDTLKMNLMKQNFGVLFELNLKDKLQEKDLHVDNDFVILEVCNPLYAKKLLDKNNLIGYGLPCKIIVRKENNETFIGLVNPEAMIEFIDQEKGNEIAHFIKDTLENAINASI